jgi:hypothetical protein
MVASEDVLGPFVLLCIMLLVISVWQHYRGNPDLETTKSNAEKKQAEQKNKLA